jgi:polyferredoxin
MDLLQYAPVRLIAHRRTRLSLQLAALLASALIVAHGLLGPQDATRNLAGVVPWVLSRGALLLVLLAIGNLFCAACPMMLVRDAGRRLVRPRYRWPRALRRKWPALALLGGGLFAYEQFDLWSLPRITGVLVLAYFAAALLVDLLFTGASFCKYVCPLGQFNFAAATLAPFSLQVRDAGTCGTCRTVDCIRGSREGQPRPLRLHRADTPSPSALAPRRDSRVHARGCELGLFLPAKVGNLDCTLCLDCVRACPHDNIGLFSRVPGAELVDGARRSGIGRLVGRPDLAALAVIFTFGSLVNAFAMTGPAVHVQHVTQAGIGATAAVTLSVLFLAGLIVAPAALLAGASAATRALAPASGSMWTIGLRYAHALVPLGAGIWLAHYGFHALTGALAIIPVTQSAIADLFGWAVAGEPVWTLRGMSPGTVFPMQLGCIVLGALGSAGLTHAIATSQAGSRTAALPWSVVIAGLAATAIWILAQPMDMRGMVMPG